MKRKRPDLLPVALLCAMVAFAGPAAADDWGWNGLEEEEDYRSSTYDYGVEEDEYWYDEDYDQYAYDGFAEDEYVAWDDTERDEFRDPWNDPYGRWDSDRGVRDDEYGAVEEQGYHERYGYVPGRQETYGAWNDDPGRPYGYDAWEDDENYWTDDWHESEDTFSDWYEGDWF